jgi:hypothetical protein
MTAPVRLQLADDLERLLRGQLTAAELEDTYRGTSNDALADVWANLSHFIADEDIRKKDAQYKRMQESELVKLIALLRAGRGVQELRMITFLGTSRVQI